MIKREKRLKPMIRIHVVPLMRDMREMIRRSDDVSEEDRCLQEVWCLYYIEYSEYLLGDWINREKTLEEAIAIMERVFKDRAGNYLVYAACLYNLGETYENTSRPNEACEYYRKAIAAYGKAEDFNDETKAEWTKISKNKLLRAEKQRDTSLDSLSNENQQNPINLSTVATTVVNSYDNRSSGIQTYNADSFERLLKERKYNEAYGVSKKRLQLDPAVIRCKDLVSHYRCCMLVGEAEDAIQTKDQLNKFLKEQFNTTPNEIKTFYDTIKSEGKDTEATLFNQIFGEFYENQSKADLLALMVEEPSVSQATSSLQEIQINPQGSQSGVTSRRPTLVDILLIVSESVGQLLQEEKYDQAYGVSRKRIKLDPAVIKSKDLINHYRCCMLVGEAEEANKIKDQLKTILNKKFQTTPNKIGTFADTIRGKGRYMEAILFDQIAAEFYGNQSKAGLVRISNCAGGIKESIRAMLSRDKGLKPIVRTHVIPLMRDMREMIRRSDDVSEEVRCLQEVNCLYSIELSEGLVGNLDGKETAGKEAIAIMERVFKERAGKHSVYGTCLNNLGSTYGRTSRPNDACQYFRKAIAAFGEAEDINDDLRDKKIAISIQGLKNAKRQMK